MKDIASSVSRAVSSMSKGNVIWCSPTSYTCDSENLTDEQNVIENASCDTRSTYLDYVVKVLDGFRPAIKLPTIAANRHSIRRVKRVARAVRSSVRQTFTARKAAKSADSGGGSSDPDGRPHTEPSIFKLPALNFSPVFAFLSGGAK